jgi:3',5'-cyclic AMP phosphodiesterase CpdA
VKKRWLRWLLWAAGFGCLWLNVYDDPPLRTDPYLQDVTADAATIAMITAAPVRMAVSVQETAGKVVATARDDRPCRRHALRVRGLSPGRVYSYAVQVDGDPVGGGSIRTAPQDDRARVRFAFLGDSGDQPWWVWLQRTSLAHWPARWGWFGDSRAVTEVGRQVAAYTPEFVLHLGDVVYPKGLHAHYRSGFFRPFGAALRDTPFFAVLGNHDVMDAGAAGLQLLANFHLPVGSLTGDGRCFSFARGPVRIIALDCNTDLTGDRYQPGHPAQVFLAAELAKCTEPWIVVASHFPMRSASRQMDRAELLTSLLPELAEHQVSVYLSGHDHCYQRFEPNGDEPPLVVSGGGGKDLYEVHPHRSGRVAKAISVHHWCSAEADGATMTIEAHTRTGDVCDRFAIELPAGERLERLEAMHPVRAERIRRLRGN